MLQILRNGFPSRKHDWKTVPLVKEISSSSASSLKRSRKNEGESDDGPYQGGIFFHGSFYHMI